MRDVADFADFFRAVHGGRDPLPWQERLAQTVVATGWPSEIGVPTGLGKTSCLDIAVWALARTVGQGTGRAPTRVWYVVNRRLLVDAAWEHGCRLAEMLEDPSSLSRPERGVVTSVAVALRSLAAFGSDRGPLHVARFRGGADLGMRSPDPSQPCVLFATVPMFASRWLFRGYGSSTSMRPVDAAHAGIDSLVLLDEAHLARPLLRLADQVAACDTGDPSWLLGPARARPALVALTATGEAAEDRFDLDSVDLDHPVVRQRLDAPKRGRLVESSKKAMPDDLAAEAVSLTSEPATTCVVFTNTPATARAVVERLEARLRRSGQDADVLLITGRVREREAENLRERLLDPEIGVRSGTDRQASRPLVVVATQTLEVGADVDFAHLVTETTGVRSLVQRLGRVNRLGTRPGSTCVVVHPSDLASRPVYGTEPAAVWEMLRRESALGTLELSPGRISALLGPPQDQPPRVGELLPAHLWEWAKTTTPPLGEAPVELFFDGFDAGGDVSVVWRAHRPADGVRLVPAVASGEAVDVPLRSLEDALPAQPTVQRLSDNRSSLETVPLGQLRPGDVVVLSPEDGLYDQWGWNPGTAGPVLDVSPLHSGTLLLSEEVLENISPGSLIEVGPLLKALVDVDEDLEEADETAVVDELVTALRSCPPGPWIGGEEWGTFLDGLGRAVERPIGAIPLIAPVEAARRWAAVGVRADAFEELSFTATSIELGEHLGAVGEAAEKIASALGLPASLVAAVRLAGRGTTWVSRTLGSSGGLIRRQPRTCRWRSPGSHVARSRVPGSLLAGPEAAVMSC
ncbi:MAG: type I-U CRISPR-associated helicase/endonuclease Cas3 [Acidimicrobiia bacterium]|nr:type I-U CRISPR-associated helicase/endonuclease Cas3 [Acidimicrobiia bacterium]